MANAAHELANALQAARLQQFLLELADLSPGLLGGRGVLDEGGQVTLTGVRLDRSAGQPHVGEAAVLADQANLGPDLVRLARPDLLDQRLERRLVVGVDITDKVRGAQFLLGVAGQLAERLVRGQVGAGPPGGQASREHRDGDPAEVALEPSLADPRCLCSIGAPGFARLPRAHVRTIFMRQGPP